MGCLYAGRGVEAFQCACGSCSILQTLHHHLAHQSNGRPAGSGQGSCACRHQGAQSAVSESQRPCKLGLWAEQGELSGNRRTC